MSALKNLAIFNKKLIEDLALSKLVEVIKPTSSFICFPLGLVPKHNGFWKRIHYLSYPPSQSINNHILDKVGELRYTRFQKVLKIVIQICKNCVIFKKKLKTP